MFLVERNLSLRHRQMLLSATNKELVEEFPGQRQEEKFIINHYHKFTTSIATRIPS